MGIMEMVNSLIVMAITKDPLFGKADIENELEAIETQYGWEFLEECVSKVFTTARDGKTRMEGDAHDSALALFSHVGEPL